MAVGWVGFLPVFVCRFFYTISQKTDGITKRDIEMFHRESWKPIHFGIKGQGHKSQNGAGVGLCTLVSAGFF